MAPASYRKPSDLPASIAVFPLGGALLFPRGQLPLNIFEPRYLNLIDDVLAGDRLLGMIQPDGSGDAARPGLSQVGCAGRLTSFSETGDGRYLITLTGICRFRVVREMPVRTPYRQVEADWTPYGEDLRPVSPLAGFDRDRLLAAVRGYLDRNELSADWEAIGQAGPETLVNALSALCPFERIEKQALLEAPTLADRAGVLETLMRMDEGQPRGPDGPGGQLQ